MKIMVDGEMVDAPASQVAELKALWDSPSAAFTRLRKGEFWRRCSEHEVTILRAALAQASGRMREIFDAVPYLDVNDSDYPALREGVVAALGLVRANAILKPDH